MSDKLKLVFCGTPLFSVKTLDAFYKNEHIEIINVTSMPDRKKGRGQKLQSPEVAQYAKENNIPLIQTDNINTCSEFKDVISKADLIFVIAFAQFLKTDILEATRYGCFNLHTSILPKYRGAAPIQYALLNGDQVTGVCIQKMVKKMDAGDIALESRVKIEEDDNFESLSIKLSEEAARLSNDFINKFISDEISYRRQDENEVSFAPTIKKEDCFLDLNESAEKVRNRIRAYYPFPGAFIYLDGKRLKILKVKINTNSIGVGKIVKSKNAVALGCGEGSLDLRLIQIEGKKAGDIQSLINGHRGDYIVKHRGNQ